MTTQGPVRSEPADDVRSPLPPPAGAANLPAAGAAPPPLRIGRTEREAADVRLREALRDDVITIMEYDERLGMVLAARTQDDLNHILADLPGANLHSPSEPALPECGSIVAVMSSEEQRGSWRPAKPVRVTATMGSAIVDLREAVTSDGTFHIEAKAAMGSVEVVVADDATVVLTGFAVMGEKKNTVATAVAGGPHVTVNGQAVMGSVKVRTATRRERRKHPADGASPAHPTRAPARQPVRRSAQAWRRRVIGIGLLALLAFGPGRAVVTADAVSLFGSRVYQPNDAELRGDDDIDVLSVFGSLEVAVPSTSQVRMDVTAMFGSASCDQACELAREEPPIAVEGLVLFGSLHVGSPPAQISPGPDVED